MQNLNCLIGRQPILNEKEETVAYELLFRSPGSLDHAAVTNATRATANVIINTLSGFGLDQIIGTHRGFINLELDLLMSDSLNILPKDRVVLELLETLEVNQELIDRCRFLKQEGFCLALDDHVYDPAYHELYEIVDIIKIDLFISPVGQLAEMVAKFRPYGLKLLAEKVETREEYLICRELGFELFQGYYFAKPSLIEKKKIDESATIMLKLMRLLMEDADITTLAQTFRSNPGLTYKLLLLVNSVALGLRNNVQNVTHAISMLGRQQIKRWVQLVLFASDDNRGVENPLVDMAAVRGALMEQLASIHPELMHDRDAPDNAFMIGILSLLDSIYNISMDEILSALSLSEEIREALTGNRGIYGKLLEIVEISEKMDFRLLNDKLQESGISWEDLLAAQVKAYNWHGGATLNA